jgi:diguanylate cyclase (GGDEF)-like protein
MDMELKKLISLQNRTKRNISVILADIDHFKKINDTFGHLAGDKVIVEVATMFKKETRDIDLAIRYGGEEFLLILPHTAKEEATVVAEKLRHQISKLMINELGEYSITISLGVTMMQDDDTINTLIARADNALYSAKASGRNKVATMWENI